MKLFALIICSLFLIGCNMNQNSAPGELLFMNRKPSTVESNKPEHKPVPTKIPVRVELPQCKNYCKDKSINSNRSGFSYLSFPNFGYLGIGRCRGHALVTQKISMLAKFNDSKTCNLSSMECLNSITEKLEDIMNFKVRSFGNFTNLFELSQNEVIKNFLYNKVKNTSHKYKAGPGKIENPESSSRELNVYYELKRRTQLGHLPYVGVRGKLTGSHALLIYRTGFAQNTEVLCVRDPNIVLGSAEACESYVFIGEDEKIFYKRHDREADHMSFFSLTSDEDKREKKYETMLYKVCLERSFTEGLCTDSTGRD